MENRASEVTMVAYLLEASDSGKKVIRILSDDTDVLVLLLYWVWKRELYWTCSVHGGGTLEWCGDRHQCLLFTAGAPSVYN